MSHPRTTRLLTDSGNLPYSIRGKVIKNKQTQLIPKPTKRDI